MTHRNLGRVQNLLLLIVLLLGTAAVATDAKEITVARPSILWFDHPATDWMTQALPIGNGRIGAMIFGGVQREQIQFNEDSLWIGDENDTGAYQAFGDVLIDLDRGSQPAAASEYRRELDIGRAVHTTSYTIEGTHYRREYFVSHPANVIVLRLTADKPAAYTGAVALTDMHKGTIAAIRNRITSKGSLAGYKFEGGGADYKIALDYEAQVVVLNDGGSLQADGSRITFRNADGLTILINAGTDYLSKPSQGWRGKHPHERITSQLDAAAKTSYAELLAAHLADYRRLFDRTTLNLGSTPAEQHKLPTNTRLLKYSDGAADPELESLVFQYGRYLMIASSRDALPANLQGLWNNSNHPPWRSDWHSDINVQMNYWPVETTNLCECAEPYINWLDARRETRRAETQSQLHRRGWVMHFENGAFGGGSWGHCQAGGAWCAQALWEHYAFGGDKTYLRDTAYPILKELCEYWDDALKARPDGKLVAPSNFSPEHGPHEEGVSFDQQLVWDLFNNYIAASKELNIDADYRTKIAAMRDKLLGPQIGKWGQLQEWATDRDDPKDDHRHTSHLVAVFSGQQISPRTTPALAKAAEVSLRARGDQSTGWAMAWRINLWARLLDGDHAYKLLHNFIRLTGARGTNYANGGGLYSNLFCAHPPFQIDGNFGSCSGMAEMLLQSHLDGIDLLPALPSAWPKGNITGLRARGGFEVDISWEKSKPTSITVRSKCGNRCKVRFGGKKVEFDTKAGGTYRLDANLAIQ